MGCKGYKFTAEQRQKLSDFQRGRTKSAAHRAALSVAASVKKPWLERPHELTCCFCGVAKTLTGYAAARARRDGQRFCSLACFYDSKRRTPTRNWRGANWRVQADEARRRDKDTCQRCFVTQKRPRLPVHHRVSFFAFNGDHEAANALSNLETVCRSCHLKIERPAFTS